MLKFTEITEEKAEKLASEFSCAELALSVMESFDYSDPDVSYAVCEHEGFILVRIFDLGRYMFLYPIEMRSEVDTDAALLALSEYAMREEIGFTLTGVPTCEVERLLRLGFRHLDVDLEDEDSYRVRVKTECELASDVGGFELNGLSVSLIDYDCASAYGELCRDAELNRFWGYDYREDAQDADDEFFIDEAKSGFARGASLTFALKFDGELVGTSELFAFDGRGSCECAVKIARWAQGRGFGSLGIEAAIKVAQELGLSRLYCDVMNENVHSIRMVSKYFCEVESAHSDRKHFVRNL